VSGTPKTAVDVQITDVSSVPFMARGEPAEEEEEEDAVSVLFMTTAKRNVLSRLFVLTMSAEPSGTATDELLLGRICGGLYAGFKGTHVSFTSARVDKHLQRCVSDDDV
jgi:hypothetical protein